MMSYAESLKVASIERRRRLGLLPVAPVVQRWRPPTPPAQPVLLVIEEPPTPMIDEGYSIPQSTKRFVRSDLDPALEVAARECGTSVSAMLGPSRCRRAFRARYALAYVLLTAYPHLGWMEIGRVLIKDHSSVIHGVREFAKTVDEQIDLLKAIADALELTGGG